MHRPALAVLLLFSLIALPVLAEDDDPEPEVVEATAKEVRHELKIFKKDFATEDIDYKLDAVIRLSRSIHKDVMKELLKLAQRDPDPYVRAEAVKGLAGQTLYPKDIGKRLHPLLSDDDLDPKILSQVILTLGKLHYTKAWEEITDLMAHDDDHVVVNVFWVLGEWKELRACLEIQGFWDAYPTSGTWSTGSVTVDTGTAGSGDQKAAKAKWMAKYGGKRKQRARPKCVDALKIAVEEMTGLPLVKPDQFRDWRSEHKMEIRAAKKRRD